MGWCHEFGPQIKDGCDHGMVAGADACECPECGVRCEGRFTACGDVWARRSTVILRRPAPEPVAYADDPATVGDPVSHAAVPAAQPFAVFDAEVLDWLHTSFEHLAGELKTLHAALDERRAAEVAEMAAVTRELSALTAELPKRLTEALGELIGDPAG